LGIKNAKIYIYTPVGMFVSKITGEGVLPLLSIENKLIDFGNVNVGSYKDTVAVMTIKNIGTSSLEITNTKHSKPNDTDFSTISNGGAFTLEPGAIHEMTLRFSAREEGYTNGTLEFEYNGIGSPAKIYLYAQGVNNKPRIASTPPLSNNLICNNSISDTLKFWNSGGDTLNITSIKIAGADAAEFKIIKNPVPAKLFGTDTVLFIYKFLPTSTGTKTANIIITSNSIDSNKLTLPISYSFSNFSDQFVTEFDLGGVFQLVTKDTTISITNKGSLTNKYFIRSSISAIVITPAEILIPPGRTENLNLHYDGSFDHDTSLIFTLTVADSLCGLSSNINSKLTIWSYKMMVLESGSIKAVAGKTIQIPIYLRNGDIIKFTGIDSIYIELSFNETLLLPIGYPNQSTTSNGNRILRLTLPTDKYLNGILTKIKMTTALGNAEETELKLQNIRLIGGSAAMDSINGIFTLLGVCYDGGKRLLNPSGSIKLYSIQPNPADDNIDVVMELVENTGYKLTIFNSIGQIVREIKKYNTIKGIASEKIDITDLSAGVYNLFLQTESERVSGTIIILR
jgi:hypothetical protein